MNLNWLSAATAAAGTGALGAIQAGLISPNNKIAGWIALGSIIAQAFQTSIVKSKVDSAAK